MSFLGIDASLSGRRWVGPDAALDRAAQALAQHTQRPLQLCSVLARLGVAPEAAEAFLAPQIRDLLPDPRSLLDMDKAGARILAAIEGKQAIAIFGDYDVDGGASSALLIDYLRAFGQSATLYIPDRIDEGYGPNAPAMAQLAQSHDLVICVDCGTLSHEALEAAKGADVLVLDHHLGGETLPPAYAVVNPNRQDESSALGHLCAAAVVFLTLVEVNRLLREKGQTTPNLMGFLDLVALATVADVAPLIGVNRALVRQGLKVMAGRHRPGLVALGDVARLDSAPASYHLGYVFGPRVNAGGRIGKADLGARLLATNDPHEAVALAEELDRLNTERREIEAAVREAAIEQVEARDPTAPLVWAAGDGWHPGVVGIVAARLKEAFNRPAVVIGFEGEDGKGSARSIRGVDLGASIHRLSRDGSIEKGGGHKMAAGLSLKRSQLEPAMAQLSELLAQQGAGEGGPTDLKIDDLLMPGAATLDLIAELDLAGPFGASAPAPRFALPNGLLSFAKVVGQGHLKLRVSDDMGHGIDGILFGAMGSELGPQLLQRQGHHVHIAGRLETNTWQGRQSAQLKVDDAAIPQ
ncbi:MAG: single-stranded-DNA-specific exonuclease RecJ [Pseudomonadota bacterium]